MGIERRWEVWMDLGVAGLGCGIRVGWAMGELGESVFSSHFFPVLSLAAEELTTEAGRKKEVTEFLRLFLRVLLISSLRWNIQGRQGSQRGE
jgi:hypothetical protein